MDKQKKQDIIVRICCVIAALALWMYIRSSEDPVITSIIKYVPVQIINEDTLEKRELVLMPNQEFYVNLTVKAPSSTIRDLDKNKDFVLVADLDGYALTPGENKVQVTVKEWNTGVSVVNAEALSMKLNVDTLAEKYIDVVVDPSGEVAEGYYADEFVISPSSIKVFGPKTYLDQVSKSVAPIDITNAATDIDKTCKLTLVNSDGKEVSGLSISHEYVQVKSKVKKGKYLGVNVKTKGISPPGVSIESIEAIPKSIEVAGGSEVIDEIKAIDTVDIDISGITENTTREVKLIIPSEVRTVNNESTVKVKFTVKKYSEATFSIPINYANLGEKLTLEDNPPSFELTISGEASEIAKLTAESFTATVELKDLAVGNHQILVKLTGAPASVKIVKKTPENVTITIKAAMSEETSDNGN